MKHTLLVLALLLASPARAELVERSQWLMGTELRIVIETDGRVHEAVEEVFRDCFAAAAETERVLSRWHEEAELARLNAAAGREVEVSEALFAWLERCAIDARRTGGAFDPSVGTWILHPGADVEIGMDRIDLDPRRRTVRLPEGMALDSGGDGKGVAVDEMAGRLRAAGLEGMISFGGSSCYGVGDGPDGEGWSLAVTGIDGGWLGTALLRDRALSVSRSMQVDQLGGGETVRRPHIYDPATGELVTVERTSIVVAPTATAAEVLSTALVVRGRAGLDFLVEYPGAEALLTPLPERAPEWWHPAPPRTD